MGKENEPIEEHTKKLYMLYGSRNLNGNYLLIYGYDIEGMGGIIHSSIG